MLDAVEFATNPDPRCPCVLLLDTSASMTGQPIDLLNEGLQVFHRDIQQDELAQRRTEVAIVTFGNDGVHVMEHEQESLQSILTFSTPANAFITAGEFEPPTLVADGYTPMGEAIHVALDLLQDRKLRYQANGIAYYRPWIFLITDGAPTDEWFSAAQRVQEEVRNNGLAFFAVGVPPNANMEILSLISGVERPPVMLDGLKFAELFVWLSRSQQQISRSRVGEQVPLPSFRGWGIV